MDKFLNGGTAICLWAIAVACLALFVIVPIVEKAMAALQTVAAVMP